MKPNLFPAPIAKTCLFAAAVLFSFLIFFSFSAGAAADTTFLSVHLDESSSVPDGAVFLIVDGLGSYYLYPELKGETLTGEKTEKAVLSTLPEIWENGFRVSEMAVPVPVTEKGHSVLVTGNPSADAEMVGYTQSTFLDILRQNGFLCIGVMQRGDFESMRSKFDVVIYDPANSANQMDFAIETHSFDSADPRIVQDLVSVFESQKKRASSYTDTKDTGAKYAGYNRWGTDTALEALAVMEKYPEQKFIVVINVGGVDSTGHYRGYYAYLDILEKLDKDLEKLFDKCRRNNYFFILTSDHGMSFEALDKKGGGHSSAKYAKTRESLHIPFVVYGSSVQKNSFFSVPAGQEDVAPTLLSLFNIPEQPRFSKGNVLPAKSKGSLYLEAPYPVHVRICQRSGDGDSEVFNSKGFRRADGFLSYAVSGLEPGNYLLKWAASEDGLFSENEISLLITSETRLDLSKYLKTSGSARSIAKAENAVSSDGFLPPSALKNICFLLIALIDLAGAGSIYYLYRKEKRE